MTQQIQQDIEAWLWESANILRGPVDPANLRDFVFPLLFLERQSDTWDEEQEKGEILNIWTEGQPECVNDYKL